MTTKQPPIDHAIVDVLIVDGDKFLLIEEGKPNRKGLYNLPGGHVEAHESLFEAAIRETKEETGYDIELTGIIGIYQSIYDYINVSGPAFSARITGGERNLTPAHPSQKWVTQSELEALAKEGKLFTSYPPIAVKHFVDRGPYPLDIVYCSNHASAA